LKRQIAPKIDPDLDLSAVESKFMDLRQGRVVKMFIFVREAAPSAASLTKINPLRHAPHWVYC
jgi:hypothetical protein